MPQPKTRRPIHAAALASFAFALLVGAAPAHAQFGGSVSLQSDNRFRGVSLSDDKPQALLSANYDAAQGWYGGALLGPPPVGDPARGTLAQAYVGRVVGLGTGLDAEAGLTTTRFSGASGVFAAYEYNYSEIYAGLIGESWNARLYYSGNYFGRGQHSLYTELNANTALSPSIQGFVHVGALSALNGADENPHGPTRLDLRTGASWRYEHTELQLAWVAVTRGGPYGGPYEHHPSTLVLGALMSF